MGKFTVEEINFICVLDKKNRRELIEVYRAYFAASEGMWYVGNCEKCHVKDSKYEWWRIWRNGFRSSRLSNGDWWVVGCCGWLPTFYYKTKSHLLNCKCDTFVNITSPTQLQDGTTYDSINIIHHNYMKSTKNYSSKSDDFSLTG